MHKPLAEFAGTFTLVFFGCGVVHTATLCGAQEGLWQIAVVWGFAVTFGIYISGAISGGHLNPAMTLAFAVHRQMPLREVVPYWIGQFAGAFCAAALLFTLFAPTMTAFEKAEGLQPKSIMSARCYGEYYASPHGAADTVDAEGNVVTKIDWRNNQDWKKPVPMSVAFLGEAFGTFMLAFIVFALIDPRNGSRPASHLIPLFIGMTIAVLISVIAPLTQAGFNPARDFAPRVFAYLAGWGETAIPGPNGHGFWVVYIVAPCVGSVLGGFCYDILVRPGLPKEPPSLHHHEA
ncbi:MAG: aquaporin [Planctomycetaceae bacterium]|jgi:glycerol uptake facilitator protein|nr:aquaporin [Planctomycetaceae bacterium]